MPRRLAFALSGCLVLAVVLVYSNHFDNAFHFDDFHTVTDNPYIRSLRNIPQFFTNAETFSTLPTNRSYRPLISTSLALDLLGGRRTEAVLLSFLHLPLVPAPAGSGVVCVPARLRHC
jgi:hypothetical protein